MTARAQLTYRVCPLEVGPVTGWRRVLLRVLGAVLPLNDPDFDFRRESIAYWWLELDGWEARREIGFEVSGAVLRLAPIGDNWGVFAGAELSPAHLVDAISAQQFEEAWSRAVQGWTR